MKRVFPAVVCILVVSVFLMPACDRKPSTPAPAAPVHTHDDGHNHDHDDDHHSGKIIALGDATIGVFAVSATRDEGEITPGKDTPVDVTVTPSSGSAAKVRAVRLWIGTRDSKGSVKARAEIENPKEPTRWHTHVEVPNPIPQDAMLWIEVEDDAGATNTGSVPLKM